MRRVVLALSLFVLGRGIAGEPVAPLTPECLIRMSRCQLLDVYRGGAPTPPPVGFVRGYPIFEPGKRFTVLRTHATRLLWQGKVFNDAGDVMMNRVVGLKMVHAQVFAAESWFDGGPAMVYDYQCTSKLFADVRDEVREVSPGVFLGLTYQRKPAGPELAVFFVLDGRPR